MVLIIRRAGGAVALDDSDGDDEEGEEAPTHTFDEDSEDNTESPATIIICWCSADSVRI